MRTTVVIDDKIARSIMAMSKAKNRSAAIRYVLEDWIRLKHLQELKALRGKVDIQTDWKKLREMEKNNGL
ncbi:MAG: hypothetical protein ACLFUS_12865 [Candidatus Sumerlaeia bacterium]